MVDWHDTQAFFQEHWRPIVIVSVVVVVIVAAISVALVLTLKRKVVPSTTGPPFNGPLDINGDPPQGSGSFAYPQIITNPLPTSTYFGAHTFVHEAGYIATTLQRTSTTQSMLFYYTNLNGEIQGPQEILLDFLRDAQGNNLFVCNGMFAPIFNRGGEVYYLFVSLGYYGANGNAYPGYVLLFSLDTSVTSNVWTISDIDTQYSATLGTHKVMKLPTASYDWVTQSVYPQPPGTASIPWYGSFGNKIRVVLDDNEAVVKQSLYISGSEFNPALPGGNLYWFVLQDNTTSPSIILLYTIQDAKLLMMKTQGDCPNAACSSCTGGCTTFVSTSEQACLNGFASDFYVTSGNRSDNILVVANSTPQDNCVLTGSGQPCAPKGYVQGYNLNAQGGSISWVQPQAGSNTFLYRYIGQMDDPSILGASTFGGFANSVSVVNGMLFIGQGQPNAGGNAEYLVLPWVQSPLSNGFLSPIATLTPSTGSPTGDFPLTPLYPLSTEGTRYNQGVQLIDDGSNQMLVTTWYQPAPADVVSIQKAVGTSDLFSAFALVQTFGAGYSSQSTESPILAWTGFAQTATTWLSRTGASVRLAVNDPFRGGNTGRIIILTRKRQG